MPLFIVATPIGNPQDISQRAITPLREADLVVGEELKALRQILKNAGVQAKATDQLNEHSKPADLDFLLNECRNKNVALVSDCGTPGFCDPGADLARLCHREKIKVHPVPGASSLMSLIAVAGVRLDTFTFRGFLPAKNELREAAWKEIAKLREPAILMETPYRAEKFIDELRTRLPGRLIVLGLNLTQENERLVRAKGADLAKHGPFSDAEPIALILPESYRE